MLVSLEETTIDTGTERAGPSVIGRKSGRHLGGGELEADTCPGGELPGYGDKNSGHSRPQGRCTLGSLKEQEEARWCQAHSDPEESRK